MQTQSVVQQTSTLNVSPLCWGAALTQIPSLLHKYIWLYLTQSNLCSWLQGLPPLKQWADHYHNQITNDYVDFQKCWAAKYIKIYYFFSTSSNDKSVLSSSISRLLGQTLNQKNKSWTSKLRINRKCIFGIFQGGTVLFPICKIRQNENKIQLVCYYFKEKHTALQNIH